MVQHSYVYIYIYSFWYRVSDVIKFLIEEFTKNNSISVIATVTNLSNLNRRIYSSRGHHLFNYIINLPNLDKVRINIKFHSIYYTKNYTVIYYY